MKNFLPALMVLCLLGPGCSTPPPDPAQLARAANAARETQAQHDVALYEQMRQGGKYDLAAELGRELLQKFPGTAAAAQVQKTLPGVGARADAARESQRIAHIWTYNNAAEAGGMQRSAYVYARDEVSAGGKTQRLRLVLREHPQWGESVYLLLDSGGFACAMDCSAAVRFDEAPAVRMATTIPPTGEPAIFIDEHKAFIARLAKAHWVHIETQLKGAAHRSSASFEIEGLDTSRLH